MANLIILLLLTLGAVHSTPVGNPTHEQCGYRNCPATDPSVLNVHIVAHTHDDVGWLKTVDQYYYGSRNNIQKAGVQYILDSVVKELWEDPKRKFIYVETAFFWKWWVRQSEKIQSQVRTLFSEERLQFVGGAWSMNDEAAVHYQSTIDQFTWGLSKINDTFGPCALPRVGWQIDPFGHSREFASLLAAMGYDGLFLGRIDYQDKGTRLKGRSMEMLWRGNDDLGKSSDIFTGVLYNTYSPPPGFCFDVLCNDEPIVDDVTSPMYNVEEKISKFISYVTEQSHHYVTNNVAVTMGGDFTYQDAAMWYTNLDKLIQYTNLKAAKEGLNITLFYSTPNCYLKAVKDANPTLPIKQDDFFPYASDPNSYWTGYFTSRPTTKYFEREGNNYLQMAKQLQVLANLEKHNMFMVNSLKSAMGVMQHHDAITGTEKQHVSRDYERLLDAAVENSLVVPRQAFSKMMSGDPTSSTFSFDRCRLNETSCNTSERSERFVVTLYNPVAWLVKEPIRIPVKEGIFEVFAPNGDKIDSQLSEIPEQVLNIPTRTSEATHELVFIAYLKPLMYKSFYIRKITKSKRDVTFIAPKYENEYYKTQVKESKDLDAIDFDVLKDIDGFNNYENLLNKDTVKIDEMSKNDKNLWNDKETEVRIKEAREKIVEAARKREMAYPNLNDEEMRMLSDEPMVVEKLEDYYVMEYDNIKVHIDNTSGEIRRVYFPNSSANISISFYYYPGCVGNNEIAANRSSGAYIFRPNATQPIPLTRSQGSVTSGKVFSQIQTIWSDNVVSLVRLYRGLYYLEVDWLVGPIDITDNIGKEFIVKYATDITTNGEFYTDSNGRQILKRKLDKRPQYNVSISEPVGGNYYPVTNEIYVENGGDRFTVLTDRSQGGSSLSEGEIELMLHRRLLHDDAFGVGEALNETANGKGLVVKGTHRLILSNLDHKTERKNIVQMHLRPIVFVSDAKSLTLDEWLKMKNCFSYVKQLPDGVHLLTLEPWGEELLLRLENLYKSNTQVDLNEIFVNIHIKSVRETTLSAHTIKKHWEWKTDEEFSDDFNEAYGGFEKKEKTSRERNDDGRNITLNAKEIRTFIVDYEFVQYP